MSKKQGMGLSSGRNRQKSKNENMSKSNKVNKPVSSEEVKQDVVKKQPFYKSQWFIFGVIMLVVSVVFGFGYMFLTGNSSNEGTPTRDDLEEEMVPTEDDVEDMTPSELEAETSGQSAEYIEVRDIILDMLDHDPYSQKRLFMDLVAEGYDSNIVADVINDMDESVDWMKHLEEEIERYIVSVSPEFSKEELRSHLYDMGYGESQVETALDEIKDVIVED